MGMGTLHRRDRCAVIRFAVKTDSIPLFSVLSMKSYLVALISFLIIGLLSVAGVVGARYWIARDISTADVRQGQLLRFQDEKIRNLAPGSIDTVFIGDSALGNAIDVSLFVRLNEHSAINLALTGSFGYGAGLYQLRELAKSQPRLRNVILLYSVDAMASGLLPEGYFFTSPIPVFSLPAGQSIALLKTYLQRLIDAPAAGSFLLRGATGKLSALTISDTLRAEDYVISRGIISLEDAKRYKLPHRIQPSSTVFLAEIADLCRTKNWNCVYAHGPVLSSSLAASPWSRDYFDQAAQAIEGVGIKVIGGPLAMANEDRGDTVFHVRFERRSEFTSRYTDLLKVELR